MNRISLAARLAAVLAGSAVAACRPAAPPLPGPAPAPAVPAATRESTIIADPAMSCVVQGGRIFQVEIEYRSATSDSLVNGRPFHEVFPLTAEYASTARWYHANEPIVVAGRRYIKYGLPRILGTRDVMLVGSYQGVSVFAEPPSAGRTEIIYLPIEVGCMFQPYQVGHFGAAVRG